MPCACFGDVMKVSDVDVHIIEKLLQCVPQGMEITAIELTDGYNLKLSASTNILSHIEKENSLDDLKAMIREYNKAEKKRLQ